MDKLDLTTPDFTDENIAKIAALFPNVVTEARGADGKVKRAIDFDALKQELSGTIVEGPQERYHLNWPGKRGAMLAANAPINKTLRPVREESVDFDSTKNLFIEGDNLDALKLLQETYLGKVKMIYIDPPYNTGKDFIYKDNFTIGKDAYEEQSGQRDEEGGRLVANPESNGRYHSDWLTMMYPRLKISRNLLKDEGIIFISIDDHEIADLRIICDEIFGPHNCLAILIWQHSLQPKGYSGTFSVHHNFVLCYQKCDEFELANLDRTDENNKNYSNPDKDIRGDWRAGDVRNALYRPNLIYTISTPSGKKIEPPANGWRWSKETVASKIATGEIIFSSDETRIIRKIYLDSLDGRTPETILFGKEVGTTRDAAGELKKLFDNQVPFDTPKPTALIDHLIELAGAGAGDLILDFFAGSSTTAHAVQKKNSNDGLSRYFVMVQMPQPLEDAAAARLTGFQNIAEISKERIRRAGAKILAENPDQKGKLDVGFRVLKIDSSNMADVYHAPEKTSQADLLNQVSNIKADRTGEDLLFQVLLDWGVDLTLPIVRETVAGREVFFVDGNALAACFETGVSEALVKELAVRKPLRVVFRDDGFDSDATRINTEQWFKHLSPVTDVKVI